MIAFRHGRVTLMCDGGFETIERPLDGEVTVVHTASGDRHYCGEHLDRAPAGPLKFDSCGFTAELAAQIGLDQPPAVAAEPSDG